MTFDEMLAELSRLVRLEQEGIHDRPPGGKGSGQTAQHDEARNAPRGVLGGEAEGHQQGAHEGAWPGLQRPHPGRSYVRRSELATRGRQGEDHETGLRPSAAMCCRGRDREDDRNKPFTVREPDASNIVFTSTNAKNLTGERQSPNTARFEPTPSLPTHLGTEKAGKSITVSSGPWPGSTSVKAVSCCA